MMTDSYCNQLSIVYCQRVNISDWWETNVKKLVWSHCCLWAHCDTFQQHTAQCKIQMRVSWSIQVHCKVCKAFRLGPDSEGRCRGRTIAGCIPRDCSFPPVFRDKKKQDSRVIWTVAQLLNISIDYAWWLHLQLKNQTYKLPHIIRW